MVQLPAANDGQKPLSDAFFLSPMLITIAVVFLTFAALAVVSMVRWSDQGSRKARWPVITVVAFAGAVITAGGGLYWMGATAVDSIPKIGRQPVAAD